MNIAGKSRRENSFDLTKRRTAKALVASLYNDGVRINPFLKLLGWLWLNLPDLPAMSETATTRRGLEKLISRACRLTSVYKKSDNGDADTRYASELVSKGNHPDLCIKENAEHLIFDIFQCQAPTPTFFQILAWLKDNTPKIRETGNVHSALDHLIATAFGRSESFYNAALEHARSLLHEEDDQPENSAPVVIATDELEKSLASLRLEITKRITQYPEDAALESRLKAMLAAASESETEESASAQSQFDELARALQSIFDNPATPEDLIDLISTHFTNANPVTDRHLIDAFVDSLREKLAPVTAPAGRSPR